MGNSINQLFTLSVVIISRNEAKNIARSIEAVLRAVADWPHAEVLLVDSASTDETIEIARRYPINIVQLKPSWFLSASAGRYIGTCYTHGDFIFYIDGDMELDSKWLNRAIPFAIEHPQYAAISGYWRDIYTKNGEIVGEVDWRRDPESRMLETEFLSGALLCRRSAFLKAGGFQPFIKSEEEIDLCIRLRHAGYKLMRLPYLICRHYCIPTKSLAGNLRRVRLNLWLGYGQVPRHYLGTELFWIYLKLNINLVSYFLGIAVSFISLLLTILSGNMIYFAIWMLLIGFSIIILSIKNHSVRKTFFSLFTFTLIAYSAVRGFLMTLQSPDEYPTDADIVKEVNPTWKISL